MYLYSDTDSEYQHLAKQPLRYRPPCICTQIQLYIYINLNKNVLHLHISIHMQTCTNVWRTHQPFGPHIPHFVQICPAHREVAICTLRIKK